MKINFFGSEKFSLSIIEKIFESGFEIVSITTKPDAPKGRGKNNASTVVADFGMEHGIKVLKPKISYFCFYSFSYLLISVQEKARKILIYHL